MATDPGSIGMGILEAFRTGQAEAEQRRYRSALSTYAVDPNESNLNAIAQYNPELVIQERGRVQQQQQAAAKSDLQRRAAAGDQAALAELSGIDLDAWGKLDTQQRTVETNRMNAIGNAAFDVARRPPEQQPAVWDSYIDQLSRQYPELAEYKGQYSPELLQSTIAAAGQTQKWLETQRPDYQVIPEGGTLVDTRSPQAIQQFSQMGGGQNIPQVTNPAQIEALPPGALFIAPDGTQRRKPGGPASAPGGFQR